MPATVSTALKWFRSKATGYCAVVFLGLAVSFISVLLFRVIAERVEVAVGGGHRSAGEVIVMEDVADNLFADQDAVVVEPEVVPPVRGCCAKKH